MQSGDALCLSQGANKKSVAPGSPETLKWLNAEALVQDEIVAQVRARQRSKERLCMITSETTPGPAFRDPQDPKAFT